MSKGEMNRLITTNPEHDALLDFFHCCLVSRHVKVQNTARVHKYTPVGQLSEKCFENAECI